MRHRGSCHLATHRRAIALSAFVFVRPFAAVVLAPAAGWITPLTHELGKIVPPIGARIDDRHHGSTFYHA